MTINVPQKPAFHASMLSTLSKCGMQFYWRYIEGKKVPPGVAMVIGTGTHKAVEFDTLTLMRTGKPAALDDVKQVAAEALDTTWLGEEPMLDDDEKSRGAKVVRAEAKDMVVSLAAIANKERTPNLKPVGVEHKIRLTLDAFPFDLEGTVDLIEIGKVPGTEEISDVKTAAKKPTGNAIDRHPQLDLYTMLRTLETGNKPTHVGLHYLVKHDTRPSYVPLRGPAISDFEPIKARIEAAANMVAKEAFYPTDPTGPNAWVCTAKFCGYFDMCVYGRRNQVQV